MSSIVTFYSYKGGVGRSMALANIAFDLARKGKKVLMIDWDLEAPGLERYFSNFSISKKGKGLLNFFTATTTQHPDSSYTDHVWTIQIDEKTKIDLLPSGREDDPRTFSKNLQEFKWSTFFEDHAGGAFLENLRNQWLKDYDLILIDSRTGLSDASGICTIFLPDILIPMFTANYQSLYGVRDIMRMVQSARKQLSISRMTPTILPVPSRFGTRIEFKESQEWLDRFVDTLKEFFEDWLPRWIEPKFIFEQIKIPQIDYFSFGEKLAIAEHSSSDPESMTAIFTRIADLLASDFKDVENFIGKDYFQQRRTQYESEQHTRADDQPSQYEYDLSLSYTYDSDTPAWMSEFTTSLTEFLTEELGHPPRLYTDSFPATLEAAIIPETVIRLEKTKTLLFIATKNSLRSEWGHYELEYFLAKEKDVHQQLLFLLIVDNKGIEVLPPSLKEKQLYDFSKYAFADFPKKARLRLQFSQDIEQLSKDLAESIKNLDLTATDIRNIDSSTHASLVPVKQLAQEYNNTRRNMKASSTRTYNLTRIFNNMKSMVSEDLSWFDELSSSDDAGERLAAIAQLQVFPDVEKVEWLAQHVGEPEKPFVGYHAAAALYIAAKSFGKSHRNIIEDSIKQARTKIEQSIFKDSNQVEALDAAERELKP